MRWPAQPGWRHVFDQLKQAMKGTSLSAKCINLRLLAALDDVGFVQGAVRNNRNHSKPARASHGRSYGKAVTKRHLDVENNDMRR